MHKISLLVAEGDLSPSRAAASPSSASIPALRVAAAPTSVLPSSREGSPTARALRGAGRPQLPGERRGSRGEEEAAGSGEAPVGRQPHVGDGSEQGEACRQREQQAASRDPGCWSR